MSLAALLFVLYRLNAPISDFSQTRSNLAKLLPLAGQFIEFLDNYSAEENRGIQKLGDEFINIRFENVSFGYIEGQNILNDVSFEIKKHEMVGIAGRSGSGKSTIFSLLNGYYVPKSGAIHINNMAPLAQIDMNNWRDHICTIDQQNYFFPLTIKENLHFVKLGPRRRNLRCYY